MSMTARDLVDAARIRHWSFIDVQLGDGAAVLWLNQRQRHLLLKFRDALRGLIGESVQNAAVVGGALVGVTSSGVPIFITTVGDGYPVHRTAGGVPYIDTTDAPITLDPFGQSGGTPGFPLPVDAIAIFTLAAKYQDGSSGPIILVDESERFSAAPGRYPIAFISANRAVPVRNPSGGNTFADIWTTITAVQVSYLPFASVTALTDVIKLPVSLHEPIIAGLAELFAKQSKECSVTERTQFGQDARRAELEIAESAFDILGDVQTTNVIYED